MSHDNRNFNQTCTKKKNKNSKERYQRAAKNLKMAERRKFNHNRTSREDTNIRKNRNIEITKKVEVKE